MDDLARVQVLESAQYLLAPTADDFRLDRLRLANVSFESATGHELSDKVHLLAICPRIVHADDGLVPQRLEHFDFAQHHCQIFARQVVQTQFIPRDFDAFVGVKSQIDLLIRANAQTLAKPLKPAYNFVLLGLLPQKQLYQTDHWRAPEYLHLRLRAATATDAIAFTIVNCRRRCFTNSIFN